MLLNLVLTFIIYVLNRLLERAIDSMGRARLLEKTSSKGAGPIYSTKNRVNGNEAHLLDERLGFGPAGLLDNLSSKWDRPVYSTNYRMNWIVRTIYHILIFNNTERR